MPKSREQSIFITTDTHFNHEMLVERGFRPKDFEGRVLAGLSSVPSSAVLIHLGDVCIGYDERAHEALNSVVRARTRVLVRGNHDKKSDTWYFNHGWDLVVKELWLEKYGYDIVLTHEPWRGITWGNLRNLHGHTHGNGHRDYEYTTWYNPAVHIELALEHNNFEPWLLSHKLLQTQGNPDESK